MILKIPVEDRVSTYPGRVVLTPVPDEANMFDMVRADDPITQGTPINKALFDNKAYTLTGDVTLYVSPTGNDVSGDGGLDAPYKTIQKAIDAIPKYLGGFTATIDIEAGTYEERLLINGFSGGRLVIGVYGRSTTVRGIDIDNSSIVETNISKITYASGFNGNLFDVDYGSNVLINQGVTMDCTNGGLIGGLYVRHNSCVTASSGNSITTSNGFASIDASYGSRLSLSRVDGSNNYFGLTASRGAVITYESSTLASDIGDAADTGGRIFVGSGTVNLLKATIE